MPFDPKKELLKYGLKSKPGHGGLGQTRLTGEKKRQLRDAVHIKEGGDDDEADQNSGCKVSEQLLVLLESDLLSDPTTADSIQNAIKQYEEEYEGGQDLCKRLAELCSHTVALLMIVTVAAAFALLVRRCGPLYFSSVLFSNLFNPRPWAHALPQAATSSTHGSWCGSVLTSQETVLLVLRSSVDILRG